MSRSPFTSSLTTPTVDAKKTDVEKAEEADAEILAAIATRRKLASDLELAKGIQYSESLKTSYVPRHARNVLSDSPLRWRPARYIRERTEEQHQRLREKYHIIVDGEDIPPPIEHFEVSRTSASYTQGLS